MESILPMQPDYTEKNHVKVKNYNGKGKKLVIFTSLFVIIALLIGLWLALSIVRGRVSFQGRATGGIVRTFNVENSYLFASPLRASSTLGERIRVTVFILDSQGRGVFGKTVKLNEQSGLEVNEIQKVSDDIGRAIYDVSSKSPGYFILQASVEGVAIPQKVYVTFE